MQKLSLVLLVSTTLMVMSGCATKKYVRNQVTTSSDTLSATLSARIETADGQISEVRDDVDRKVSGVNTRVSELDTRTSEQIKSVRTDVQNVDQKTGQAQTSADRAANYVATLDRKSTRLNS